MRLAYVTAQTPWAGRGSSEQFILPEIRAVVARGHDVTVIPLRPVMPGPLPDGEDLRAIALSDPLFRPRYLADLGYWVLRRPGTITGIFRTIMGHRSANTVIKNLAVLPKAAQVARVLVDRNIQHLHAHWATTPATMALIAARLAGIPWSLTAHRHDIAARNLLAEKVHAASFVRVISEDGMQELTRYVPSAVGTAKLHTIHMGVDLPPIPEARDYKRSGVPCILVPARLHETKGHAYLLEALTILRDEYGQKVRCLVVGDGPLHASLQTLQHDLGLTDVVEFLGQMPHLHLLQLYARGEVDMVVLPSVVVANGEREGIPVALMEAMAFSVPVVATATGGIGELVVGAGLLVPERDAHGLAHAVRRLLTDEALARELARAGRHRVEAAFSVTATVGQLERLWTCHASPVDLDP